jgi:hypothetical protein
LKFLIKLPLTRLYGLMGSVFASYTLSTKCFPGAYPRNLKDILIQTVRALKFFMVPGKGTETTVGKREKPKGVQTPAMGVTSPDYSL